MEDIRIYLEGKRLYGDDFDASRIADWLADEKEGYAELGAKDRENYRYGYHAWNRFHGFRHLRPGNFAHVLGFGSAYGDELLPILARIGDITIVDPSDAFLQESIHGVHARYVKPGSNGSLPLESGAFDLVSCLGVLHHIPNVGAVVEELARVLRPGGQMLLREPIISMGDWRKPRRGLTRHERGIPVDILETMLERAGFIVRHRALCAFPLTPRIFRMLPAGPYNSKFATVVDATLSTAFAWNVNYHPRNALQRLRPTSAYYVVEKRSPQKV